uniref:Phosphatidylserine decarboxylase proenzyme n=1 Tax=Candidatus Aschnera chinzeii TaxID=1485666 RepID=A0AAT9G3V2_9ENTR|nr:MAG: archaetidylserine decarboxylase [Candidatus Aschnera chinzeii]
MFARITLYILQILPKYWLTKISGWIANKNAGWLTKIVIFIFIKIYNVNMEEVQENKISSYTTFNKFFTRTLKKDSRKIITGNNQLSLPADGIITSLGKITNYNLIQAKNQLYKLITLFAGNTFLSTKFNNGLFLTIYLSPKDYHRVHIPCNGLLNKMIYVPGTLFPLNTYAINNITDIFVRNERLICIFTTPFGLVAQILIGAIITGSIYTKWHGCVNNKRNKNIISWEYAANKKTNTFFFKKGEEIGKFQLGSTVITIFEPNRIQLNPMLQIGSISRVGKLLGKSI